MKNSTQELLKLKDYIGRASALFAFPILYDDTLINEENHSEKVRNMLSTRLISKWGNGYCFNDEPKFYNYFAQHSIETNENLHGSSTDTNSENAKVKALGECLERFCLINPDQHPKIKMSYKTLLSTGKNALDPAECLNFNLDGSLDWRNKYELIIRNTEMHWVLGKNLKTNSGIYIPYQLVYLPSIEQLDGDPLIRIPITTGTACGDSYEDATKRAIFECIERDSNMLMWLTYKKASRIVADDWLKEVHAYFNQYKLQIDSWDITTDLGIPSVITIITDQTGVGPAVSVGTKSDLNPTKAILGSIYEAMHCRLWIRSVHQYTKKKLIKADQVSDLASRGLYWYDRDKLPFLNFLFNSGNSIKQEDFVKKYQRKNSSLKYLVDKLTGNGVTMCAVDISHKNMINKNIYVVRVVIPQLHPMHLDEELPYIYSQRLSKINKRKKLNTIPAPFL